MVCRIGGQVVSAAYVVDLGAFTMADGTSFPCRSVYAFATAPEYRGLGLGSAVIKRAADMSTSGEAVGVICPAE